MKEKNTVKQKPEEVTSLVKGSLLVFMKTKKTKKKELINVAVIGSSGYTGSETIRLLSRHPKVSIKLLMGDKSRGKNISEIFSHFSGTSLPTIKKFDAKNLENIDVLFSCMPSGKLSAIIDKIPKKVVVIDLSADFRFKDKKLYKEYYGFNFNDVVAKSFTYGLTEIFRSKIKKSRLIACPGCYPTSVLLPLVPLIKYKKIRKQGIIIDSKSGISGAGRNTKEELLFAENYNSISAYGNNNHRHIPEMEHNLFLATKTKTKLSFTPHILPINRGILSTIYVKGEPQNIFDTLNKYYDREKFIKINHFNSLPSISDVTGSNLCRIGIMKNKRNQYTTIISVIDNLLKGASGQAVQNMNNIFGFQEDLGLDQLSFCP